MEEDLKENQSLKSKIESAVSSFTDSGNSKTDENKSAVPNDNSKLNFLSSFFNGLGVGLLLGLLLGLAVSPVVSAIIGTLSSLLVVLLGLNESYLNPVKSIRIGAFGLFCVIGILSGIYIRSHNSLAPSLQSLNKEYKSLGFSDKDARDFIAYQEFNLVPGNWTKKDTNIKADAYTNKSVAPDVPEISEQRQLASHDENMSAKKRNSVLYSSEVDAGKCYILESSNEKMSFSDIKMNFVVAGGTWKELANDLDPGLPEKVRSTALILLRDIFCASGGSGTIKVKCNSLQEVNAASSLESVRKTLFASGEVWSKIVLDVDTKIDKAYQKQLYLSLTKILCHD
jgi:hypothetical protein